MRTIFSLYGMHFTQSRNDHQTGLYANIGEISSNDLH